MNVYNPFPFYNGDGFGFLSPIFESLIKDGEKYYPSVHDYCSEKRATLEEGYYKFLEQNPKYKGIVEKSEITLWVGSQKIFLMDIIKRINKNIKESRMKNTNIVQNLKNWVEIVNKACEKECLKNPCPELVKEILQQNNMKKHERYLRNFQKEKITKKELSIISSLPFDFKTNHILYFLSKYKGEPKKYQCRKGKFAFRMVCEKKKSLSKKNFLKKVRLLNLEEDLLREVYKYPKKYSLYELKLYSLTRGND